MLRLAPDSIIDLPASSRLLALSDLHLGDGGHSDMFGRGTTAGAAGAVRHERLTRFLAGESADRDAVILCGDVLDIQQARRTEKIARAHGPALRALDELAARIPVYVVLGNHDRAPCVQALLPRARRCGGVRAGDVLFLHGHQFDLHYGDAALSGARRAVGQRVHHFFERLSRRRIRLPFLEHDNWANRAGHWLFYRGTMMERRLALAALKLGSVRHLRRWAAHYDYWSRCQFGDPSALLLPVMAYMARAEAPRVLVLGHAHQAGVLEFDGRAPSPEVVGAPRLDWRPYCIADGLAHGTYVNLGSWSLGDTTYLRLDRGVPVLRRWPHPEPLGEGPYVFAMSGAVIPGLAEWWQRYYRGALRFDGDGARRDWSGLLRTASGDRGREPR